MVILLFVLALVALLAAVALFASDARERSEHPEKPAKPSKRARRAWAREHGYAFASSDDMLASEWSRGAAAGGAPARNVATGAAYGHDAHVADLGDATVIAMGTGAETSVVVDFRRTDFAAEGSDDLVELDTHHGFTCFATQAGAGRRFVDRRVLTALEQLPAAVQAVWFEGAWAIAQLGRDATPQDWDATLAPLALLADAARTLPPIDDTPLSLPFPTRDIPGQAPTPVPEAENEPVMQRPEDPVELPTRTTGGERGEVADHTIGGDDVEAIAGDERRVVDLTRVRRMQGPSSIFDDKE